MENRQECVADKNIFFLKQNMNSGVKEVINTFFCLESNLNSSCSVLQTTKSAFRYTCTLESPVPPPNCNITYDELEICAQFSANNLDFYFIKDPGTELCDTISVIDQNVHGKQSL
jgi:hypothetical protein